MAYKDPFSGLVSEGLRQQGLTLRGLCREADLDPSFFSKVLAGKRNPPAEESVLRRIAEVLGLDAVELIVCAGRIPSEWQALRQDPGLLRQVHELACPGRVLSSATPSGARFAARPSGAPAGDTRPVVVTRAAVPEELL